MGSPVILLHGIACSVLEWQRNIDALAAHHRIYAIDLLGFGFTDKPADETYTLARIAQFIFDFLDTQGVAQAHLAGNSMGGRLALECARVAPDRVASLVLAAPVGIGRQCLLDLRLASLPWLGELLTRPSRWGLNRLWSKVFFDRREVTDELVQAKLELARLPGTQAAFLKTLRSFVGLGGIFKHEVAALQAALATLRVPTLVIWGRHDRLLPVAQAQLLADLLPAAQLQLYEECGHMPQFENPRRFNQEALGHWAMVDGGRS